MSDIIHRLIRYRTDPTRTEENERLIKAVFAELTENPRDDVRYLAMRGPADTFFHFVEMPSEGESPLFQVAAFREFQTGIRERCIEAPQSSNVVVVGHHRMLRR